MNWIKYGRIAFNAEHVTVVVVEDIGDNKYSLNVYLINDRK